MVCTSSLSSLYLILFHVGSQGGRTTLSATSNEICRHLYMVDTPGENKNLQQLVELVDKGIPREEYLLLLTLSSFLSSIFPFVGIQLPQSLFSIRENQIIPKQLETIEQNEANSIYHWIFVISGASVFSEIPKKV